MIRVCAMSPEEKAAWNQFLEEMRDVRTSLGNPEVLWYRGHSDRSWPLLPSIHRYPNGLTKEQALFEKFAQFESQTFGGDRKNEWEILFLMQHYGIPTRLLDWTSVLGVALYFALLGVRDAREPCIWVLDPRHLNHQTWGYAKIRRPAESEYFYKKTYWENMPNRVSGPISMEPDFRDKRLRAQRGMFTVHGQDLKSIDEQYPSSVRRVELPRKAILPAREFLDHADINAFSVFPDIEGLSKFIVEIVGLR